MTAQYFVDADGTLNPHSFVDWWSHIGCPSSVLFVANGTTLREQRISSGVSANFVASHLRISPQYLSDMEQGKRPFLLKFRAAYLSAIHEQHSTTNAS